MTIRTTYAAEAWDKVYDAFQQINFTAYDYDTVKESLIQYLKIYHAESFNDFIESSTLIAVLELFAYVAELLAYRVDTMSHENFITTAQRKQSILKLARLISYRASRNIPARGLVKITSIRTSEQIIDSLGNNLMNTTVFWNDPNNTNWKEQFFLIINRSLTSRFGQPQKSFQIGDVSMQLYTLNHPSDTLVNGVYSFLASGTVDAIPMEIVPADIDENGPFERSPDLNSQLGIIYASDGRGDGSDFTGFLFFIKQGTLTRTDYFIPEPTENRRIELDIINVNDTDVWVYRIDDANRIIENWKRVETLNEQNLFFNIDDTRKKFEVESLENDRIAFLFGDNNFSDAPSGAFQFWTRVSLNQNISIPKNRIVDVPFSLPYLTNTNLPHLLNVTFSLTAPIQNNSASETIEHVRSAAPATYYAQNRMVNAQDYNTFMLKDSSILKLKTINRTFAGQPKYIEWNDASQKYQNIKLFGDDLQMYQEISLGQTQTTFSSRILLNSFIEPLLQTTGVFNMLVHACATTNYGYGIISNPRRRFIEDNRGIYRKLDGSFVTPYGGDTPTDVTQGSLNEKSAIQSALDQHWYGEPLGFANIQNVRHGIIPDILLDPTNDGKLYDRNLPRTIDGINTYPPGDTGSGLQASAQQTFFGLRFHRFLKAIGNGTIELIDLNGNSTGVTPAEINQLRISKGFQLRKEVFTIELLEDGTTFSVISNIRGKLPNYSRLSTDDYYRQNPRAPINFKINPGNIDFAPGDAFIIDLQKHNNIWKTSIRKIQNNYSVNLNGWWQIITADILQQNNYFDGNNSGPSFLQTREFDQEGEAHSWIFLFKREDDEFGIPKSWSIFHRDIKLVVESPTTKFWYNQTSQILDSETLKPVVDKIRILRSNLDPDGIPLHINEIYDVVGFVKDENGIINFNKLEVMPTDSDGFTTIGDSTPDNILQFYEFSRASFEYFLINIDTDDIFPLGCDHIHSLVGTGGYDKKEYDTQPYDENQYIVMIGAEAFTPIDVILQSPNSHVFSFKQGNFLDSAIDGHYISDITIDNLPLTRGRYRMMRRRRVPAPFRFFRDNNWSINYRCNNEIGLDFMWQHFSPDTNLIDPSVSNIHDAFLLTRGYYNSVMEFVRGFINIKPVPPTPLELRTSYGYLLQNKMLSDTVVLRSGKIKLLFGDLAEEHLRAKFRVVKSPMSTFSNERIKLEIISVIDTYFDINNWDFGDQFFATELLSLIHQRLSIQISSVVLVPTYSINSFGSLFTIGSGFDEILQSCATVNDVEIIDAITPLTLRQSTR